MSVELVQIDTFENKTVFFKEFCKVFNLKEGDYYKTLDYLNWTQALSYSDIVRIAKGGVG